MPPVDNGQMEPSCMRVFLFRFVVMGRFVYIIISYLLALMNVFFHEQRT